MQAATLKRKISQAGFVPKAQARPKFQRQNASLMNPIAGRRGREERKNLDLNQANTVVFGQATSTIALINGIAQGAAENQRDGRSVHMRSLFYRFTGNMAATTTGASPIRLLIVYDKQTNAALPAATAVVVADSIENPMNLANNKRFVVLVDEEIECLGAQGPQAFSIKGYRKINLPAEFQGNGGVVANITSGGVYSLVWQTGSLLIANPLTQLYTRIRYTDA